MKVIIAGSRGITDMGLLLKAIRDSGFRITEVVSGMCPDSPDMLGVEWGNQNGIYVKEMPANWKPYGRSGPTDMRAGHKRNLEMAQYVGSEGGLIALWDGYSGGTKGMIGHAKTYGLKKHVVNLRELASRTTYTF